MPVDELIAYLTSFPAMLLFPQEERSEVLRAVYVCILRALKDGAHTIRIDANRIAWCNADKELGAFGGTSPLIPNETYRKTMRRILELDHTVSDSIFVTSDTIDALTLQFNLSSSLPESSS
jgi:hypothetical protein